MKTIALTLILTLLTGCASMRGSLSVGPENALIEDEQLRELYKGHGFCDGTPCTFNPAGEDAIARRNELQNILLGKATNACTGFKEHLVAQLKADTMGFGLLTQAFSVAGASIAHGGTAKALSASGAGMSAISSTHRKTYEVESLNIVMSGIERARTRVFKQILPNMTKDVQTYPVARAVNDAFRYHAVCTLTDGFVEASRAANSEPQ